MKDILDIQDSEVRQDVTELLHTIPMLYHMNDPERKRAKNLPRDKHNKIIVDVTKPHILEDMDYFRQSAITYNKTGKYSTHYPSKNPDSPFRKFWDEEIRRCKDGYIREKDGEWISGYYYFYLNYTPIIRTIITGERNKDGTVKADRVEDFADVWDGDYLFYHYLDQAENAGKYAVVLKARGKGYSFKAASMLNRNYFLYKRSKSYALAAESEYLDTDGILNKAEDQASFINQHCGFSKKLVLKDTLMHKISGYKRRGESGDFGFKSERIGVTLKNKPDKARGKRGKLMVWEESGSFPYIIKSWRIAQKSMEEGKRVFGLMIAFGTGGEEGVSFIGLEQLFYNSKAYNVCSIRNVFDKSADRSTCSFFVPDYWNRADCYDENGNSDVIKALEEIVDRRLLIRYNSNDSNDYAQIKAEEPVTPRDAVMRTSGSEFPVKELTDHLTDIEPNRESFLAPHYIIDLIWISANSVTWKPNFEDKPIRTHPYKGSNLKGAIEIFEQPRTSSGGHIPNGRYIGGVDPVDDDTTKTSRISLFAVWIFDLWNDVIVAQWIGRYQRANDNFDLALKLAVYYNAQLNYENKLKGMYAYFERKYMLKYLCDTPDILKDMDYIQDKRLIGNKSKGTPPSEQINSWSRREQADWMLRPNPQRDYVLGYKTIRSLEYLKETISWNLDGNFDSVSAMNMVFVIRADRFKAVQARGNAVEEEEDEWAKDEFLNNNYHPNVLSSLNIEF